jgi:DNA helicase-2/ATP-dependent DNA helicase PcrA
MASMGTSGHPLPAALEARLARLAPDQRAAATTPPGPVLCVAPAGSGKTTTVVARLAWRIALGTEPATVCALTFNRRAAEELQERSDAALGEVGMPPGSVRVSTFHALGRAILIDAGVDVSHIVDREKVLTELAGGPLPAAALRWLDDAFTRLKLDPERGPPSDDLATHGAFAAYRACLSARGALDLDDLVAVAAERLGSDAVLLARWQARSSVLFVDEAQDLDRTQLELVVLLAGERRDVFLVGDDDQTIYAWRLADVRRVLGLATRLPGLRRVDLETNHRCAPEIVRRASRLVAHNRERFAKTIRASPRAEGSVTLLPDPGDAVARARLLLGTWAAGPSRAVGSHAILARTNLELVPYAAVALELGLPHHVEDDGLLLGEPRLVEVVASAALAVVAAPAGATSSAAGHPGRDGMLPRLAASAASAGLDAALTSALLAWAAPFADLVAFHDALVARIARRRELQSAPADLTLATIHGTKGLEWDHVACVGHDDGAFPSGRALRDASDPGRVLEEERRLAYVAWTRARRTLTLVYDPGAPSIFLREAFDAHELE